MNPSDAVLLRRARLGDRDAAGTLLTRYFRAAYLIALARLGSRADAEDACQDAFVRCLERLDDCRDPDRFGAWLLQIVRNTAHNRGDYLRIRGAESLSPDLELPVGANPATHTLRAELRATLQRALAELPLVQREVVLLHDLEGFRHAEIADQLHLSETMSRRHLSDARKRLRSLLGDYNTLEPDHD
jgi:RNA polymerase sigma-70 factor (ECF subfamily)